MLSEFFLDAGSDCSSIITQNTCKSSSQSLQSFRSNFGNTNLPDFVQWKRPSPYKLSRKCNGHLILSYIACTWSRMFQLSPDQRQSFVRSRIESDFTQKETPKWTFFFVKSPLNAKRMSIKVTFWEKLNPYQLYLLCGTCFINWAIAVYYLLKDRPAGVTYWCLKASKTTVLHMLFLMTSQIRIFQLSNLILWISAGNCLNFKIMFIRSCFNR